MMKRLIGLLLATALVLSLAACSEQKGSKNGDATTTAAASALSLPGADLPAGGCWGNPMHGANAPLPGRFRRWICCGAFMSLPG